jgi:protein SCO1
MDKKPTNLVLYISAVILGIAVIVALILRRPYAYHGTVITPPLAVSDFRLQAADGSAFQLSEMKGRVVVLFFGYTSCPDVCPITLGTFKQVHDGLGDRAQGIKFVMITVDPERDTPQKMESYVAQFDREFIGLSGSLADLQPTWKELGVFAEKQESDSAAGYLVSHTASAYVIDQTGNLFMILPYGISSTDMASDLKQLLEESD